MSDSISRQAAIRWVKTECNPYGKPTLDFESGKKVIEHLEQMPSADRPQGEWIEHEHGFWTFVNDKGERDGWIPDYECNLCGARAFKFKTLFCPTCGARMKGADDE